MGRTAWPADAQRPAAVPRRAERRCRLVLAGGWLVAVSAPLAAQTSRPEGCADPLTYPDHQLCEKTWWAASNKALPDLVDLGPDGMAFTSIAGDCWTDTNTHRAVVLRRPCLQPPYAVEVTMAGFQPASPAAQAGLVLWRDADNYVRLTAGFLPAGFEFVREFNGHARTNPFGPCRSHPVNHPFLVRLRMEVGHRTVRSYLSLGDKSWLAVDGTVLPKGEETAIFFKGIGLIGVGGDMKAGPVFSDWRETPLAVYADDGFDGASLKPAWRGMLGTSGWGGDEAGFALEGGRLTIRPFCGADLYLDNDNYAFVAQRGPLGDRWQIEVRISGFDATVPGWFNKGGVVLWRGSRRMMALAVVADEQYDHMYFETIAQDAEGSLRYTRMAGFRPRCVTDAWLRIERIDWQTMRATASYDGQEWHDLGKVRIALDEAELRLFASGDAARQYPHRRWAVSFDEVRLIADRVDESTGGGAEGGRP